MSENSMKPMREPADTSPDLPEKGFFQSRWKKFGVAVATVFIAICIAGSIVDPRDSIWLIYSPAFPIGLAEFFQVKTRFEAASPGSVDYLIYNAMFKISLFGGWLLYLGLALGMMFVRKKWLVIALYVVLLALLVVNVIGCTANGPVCIQGC